MSNFPEEHLTLWTRDLQRLFVDKTVGQGQQIATWLVVGNAAALVFAFNAAIQGSACDATLIRDAARWFTAGLSLAFAGSTLGYLSALRSLAFFGRVNIHAESMYVSQFHIRELEALKAPTDIHQASYDEAGEKFASMKPRALWPMTIVGMVLFAGSVVCFAAGATLPVRGGPELLASCSKKASSGRTAALAPLAARR
jgi:hypothetical protein